MAFENKVVVITKAGDGVEPQFALSLVAPSRVETMARAARARRPQQQPH